MEFRDCGVLVRTGQSQGTIRATDSPGSSAGCMAEEVECDADRRPVAGTDTDVPSAQEVLWDDRFS